MPVVRRIRNRGATVTVESHAEVLFMPGGSVHSWTNRFTGRIRAATIAAAPVNKRPRWGHYGKPLKSTIVSARPRFWSNGHDRQRVYAAVGSTSPHAYYVDQGTGVYAGNGPYAAKVLPPWHRGSPSLYESTWRPGGPGTRKVAPVMIQGQKGQFFFEEGLKRAFQSMRLRSYQVPGEPKISDAGNSVATGLENFLGNTAADDAFKASLTEWRSWRDAAWRGDDGPWGNEGLVRRRNDRMRKKAEGITKKKPTKKHGLPAKQQAALDKAIKSTEKPAKGWESVAQKKAAAVAQFHKQNPHIAIIKAAPSGLIVKTNRGPQMIPWSRLYNLI